MADYLSSDRDFQLWVLLLQTRDLILRVEEKYLSQYGITFEQTAVLFIVTQVDNHVTIGEIARWLLRRPHSISGIVSRMERKGLVVKTRDTRRRSVVRISLTDKGKQLYRETCDVKSTKSIFSVLSDEEKKNLGLYLEKLRSRAINEGDPIPLPPFP